MKQFLNHEKKQFTYLSNEEKLAILQAKIDKKCEILLNGVWDESPYLGIVLSNIYRIKPDEDFLLTRDLAIALLDMEERFGCSTFRSETAPKTFACNHTAETCCSCEDLVSGWKAVQAARKVLKRAEAYVKLIT